jgi:hypothetical protein
VSALALGAAGAYAANADPTQTLTAPVTKSLSGSTQATIVSLDGTAIPNLPSSFQNQGQCVSWFAQHKNLALVGGSVSGSFSYKKNIHGKSISYAAGTWCKTQVTASTSDSASTSSDSASETADSSDSTTSDSTASDQGQGASHGKGHGHGHSHLL